MNIKYFSCSRQDWIFSFVPLSRGTNENIKITLGPQRPYSKIIFSNEPIGPLYCVQSSVLQILGDVCTGQEPA